MLADTKEVELLGLVQLMVCSLCLLNFFYSDKQLRNIISNYAPFRRIGYVLLLYMSVVKLVWLITGEPLDLYTLNLAGRVFIISRRPTLILGYQVKCQDHADQKVAQYLKIASQTITKITCHFQSFIFYLSHIPDNILLRGGGGRHNVVKDLLLNYVYVTGDRQFRHSIHMFHHQ